MDLSAADEVVRDASHRATVGPQADDRLKAVA
jgi:hypothetical protein